ncbi:hypothetical protein NQZ68_012295 [Dissostichus eleginoides]|nr:hypothetical protein NQZ68_012295 [Dissostichus eleginoides]
MRKKWEGLRVSSCPSGPEDLCWPTLREGANKTHITPKQGREREKEEKGGGRNQESKGGTFWLAIGFRLCQSFHFLPGFGTITDERTGGRGSGRYPHAAHSLCVLFHQKD